MTVAYDNSGSNETNTGTVSATLTIGSGPNRAAMALITFSLGNAVSGISVTGAGVSWPAGPGRAG